MLIAVGIGNFVFVVMIFMRIIRSAKIMLVTTGGVAQTRYELRRSCVTAEHAHGERSKNNHLDPSTATQALTTINLQRCSVTGDEVKNQGLGGCTKNQSFFQNAHIALTLNGFVENTPMCLGVFLMGVNVELPGGCVPTATSSILHWAENRERQTGDRGNICS